MKSILTLKAMNAERGELITGSGQRALMLGITLQTHEEKGDGQPKSVTLPTVWMTPAAAVDLAIAIQSGLRREFSTSELQAMGLLEAGPSTH